MNRESWGRHKSPYKIGNSFFHPYKWSYNWWLYAHFAWHRCHFRRHQTERIQKKHGLWQVTVLLIHTTCCEKKPDDGSYITCCGHLSILGNLGPPEETKKTSQLTELHGTGDFILGFLGFVKIRWLFTHSTHGKSPCSHYLPRYFLLFPSILSKSKILE